MMRYFIFRISLSLALIGFVMIPGIVLLRFFGIAIAAVSVFFAVCLFVLYATRPVWLGDWNLRELLFSEVHTGWQLHPLLTALIGSVFAGVGAWIITNSCQVGAPATGAAQMSAIEQSWFGIIFILIGIGCIGFGVSAEPRKPT